MNKIQAFDVIVNEINKGDYPNLQEFLKSLDLPKSYEICDLHNKCGGCKHFDYDSENKWGWTTYKMCELKKEEKCRTQFNCKSYIERNDIELVYQFKRGAYAKEIKLKNG